jgi:hypothetical protein
LKRDGKGVGGRGKERERKEGRRGKDIKREG